MKLLDLFCGEGGAGAGYASAGFAVTGVDTSMARLSRYPQRTVWGDALEYVVRYGHLYDAIHASPPCTGYTRGTVAIPDRAERYDRLIAVTRDVLDDTRRPYVIENVEGARSEMHDPALLCWTQFHRPGSVSDDDGTPLQMYRHRLFETNWPLWLPPPCSHDGAIQVAGAYGGARRDKDEARNVRKGGYVPANVDVLRRLLGTPWMSEQGCFLSIPPAYTEHIGWQLINYLEVTA